MLEKLRERLLVLHAALSRPAPKRVFAFLFACWGIIEIYDLLIAQFIPRKTSDELPTVIEVLITSAEWLSRNLSLYDWLLIGLVTVFAFTLEFAVRQNQKFSSLEAGQATSVSGNSVIPYQEWKSLAEIDLETAAAIWAGTRDPYDVSRHLRFRQLKEAVRNKVLKPHRMPDNSINRCTTVAPEELESFFRSVSSQVNKILLAVSIQDLRSKNNVKQMKKLHSGCNLSSMPIGVYGFIDANKLPSPNSFPDIIGVGGIGFEYRFEPRRRPVSSVRQMPDQCELHKTNAGNLYVVGCITKEQSIELSSAVYNKDKEFMLFFDKYDEFNYFAAIPYRNIETISHRMLDDGAFLFDINLNNATR